MERLETNANPHTEETLDPQDWRETLALSHRMVDGAVGYLRDVRDRPVWQDLPEDVRAFFTTPAPHRPEPLADILSRIEENVMPYPMGNVHPRF